MCIRLARKLGRMPRMLGVAACLALMSAGPVMAQAGKPAVGDPRAERPARDDPGVTKIPRQYLTATADAEKTQAAQALAAHLWTSPFLSQRRQGGVALPDEFLQAIARDVAAGNMPDARMHALTRILATLNAHGRATMVPSLLAHLGQAQTGPARSSARTALWAATRDTPETVFQAIRTADDERMLGDLSELARGAALPDDVRRKLDAACAASSSLAVRIQIAQTLGPDSPGYGDIVQSVISELDAAPSDEARERAMVTLGKFPGPDDAVTRAMINAVSHAKSPSRVMWRALAETGPAGLRYLAGSVQSESDTARLVDKATMMAAVASESGPLPADIAPAVIDAAIAARLRSDDPLLRSSVYALLLRSRQAAVAPIRQALNGAKPGTARDDLAGALSQLETP